ncbi:MAG: hypothetical protein E3J72_17385 [Planctomycetota bacterium]|nr:MAG: hypothetical protein E3J72_17385 [Planctomycetota bacterium]
MAGKCKVEVFSAGCPACKEAIEMINRVGGEDVEVIVLDMNDPEIAEKAKKLGVRCAPAVAVNGTLADCCQECGPDEEIIRKVLEMNR